MDEYGHGLQGSTAHTHEYVLPASGADVRENDVGKASVIPPHTPCRLLAARCQATLQEAGSWPLRPRAEGGRTPARVRTSASVRTQDKKDVVCPLRSNPSAHDPARPPGLPGAGDGSGRTNDSCVPVPVPAATRLAESRGFSPAAATRQRREGTGDLAAGRMLENAGRNRALHAAFTSLYIVRSVTRVILVVLYITDTNQEITPGVTRALLRTRHFPPGVL
jgi:hypothetical protein